MLQLRLDYRTYAVALSNAALPAAAGYFLFYLLFVFRSQSEKTNNNTEDKVPIKKKCINILLL
jgi:hypothetical protein